MQYVRGPLLVLAGAGGGKTSLLAHKIAWLLREYDVAPAALLALTVNAHSARVLRTKVQALLGRHVATLAIHTFYEFSLERVLECPQGLGLLAGFSVYDETEGEAVIERLLRERLPEAVGRVGAVRQALTARQRALDVGPAGDAAAESHPEAVAAWLHPLYRERLRRANAIDILELPEAAARLLADGSWDGRVRFLLVDEYEQAAAGEHALVRRLLAHGANLTVAADDSDVLRREPEAACALDRLQTELGEMRRLRVDRNFRAAAGIVRAVRAALETAAPPRPSVDGARLPGAPIRVLQVRGESHEGEGIVRAVLEHKLRRGGSFRDYAILYRRPEQLPKLERALQTQRVPYRLCAAGTLFDQPEVRDFWSYLRLLANPADDNAFLRAVCTPRRDIAHATLDTLVRHSAACGQPLLAAALDPSLERTLGPAQHAALREVAAPLHALSQRAAHVHPARLAQELLAELRYEDWLRDTCNDFHIAARRMEHVLQLVALLDRLAQRYPGADLRALVTRLGLNAALDPPRTDAAADGVVLIELARARGMEFAHVYIAGLDEPPSAASGPASSEPTAEVRRLTYIGLTRARESVTFLALEPEHREAGVPPSLRFLAALGPAEVEWVRATASGAFAATLLAQGPIRPPGPPRFSR